MSSAAIVAYGAISSLGEGSRALGVAAAGEPAPVGIARDEELERGGLARPFAARANLAGDDSAFGGLPSSADRAARVLARALHACANELDTARPGWRSARVGLALATSSGGMRGAEKVFASLAAGAPVGRELAMEATYFAPFWTAARTMAPLAFAPATLVLTACAAGTLAIGLGVRWLEEGACDLVLAGGFDAVSVFVASGFEVLRATTGAVPPRPFRKTRDGMSLGEGAAVLALARPDDGAVVGRARGYIAGFGASADAVHITAPDRTGVGLARAAQAALDDARVAANAVDLVNAHGTATPFNDAAEAKAIARVVGAGHRPVIHPLKAQLGHTLGAAGALETLACVDALERRVLPAAARPPSASDELDPDLPVRLLDTSASGEPRVALKLSAAFGGANAALVVTRDAPPPAAPPGAGRGRQRREAFVSRAVHVEELPDLATLAARVRHPIDKLSRTDALVRYALAAVASLEERTGGAGSLAGAGCAVGHGFATVETNYAYETKILERGARLAEPRRFPYTSPNAVAGECGVVFGLTGPGLAVGGGLHGALEALCAAAWLVRGGDADRMLVVAVDEVGDAVRALARGASLPEPPASGAIALLVSAEPVGYARVAEIASGIGRATAEGEGVLYRHALLPLCGPGSPPRELVAVSPPAAGGGWARVRLERIS